MVTVLLNQVAAGKVSPVFITLGEAILGSVPPPANLEQNVFGLLQETLVE